MTALSPAERIDALAARGVMLYLNETGELRAKCEPCFAPLLDAAQPTIRQHRKALIAHLKHPTHPPGSARTGTRGPRVVVPTAHPLSYRT